MRLALLSDIHGNKHALDAVLADILPRGCDTLACLGDVVGYGGDPAACVATIRKEADIVLLGNHDAVAIGQDSDDEFNPVAQDAIRRTRSLLDEEARAFLANLPRESAVGGVALAHAHPIDGGWPYVFVGQSIADIFEDSAESLMAIGHTHTPGIGNDRDGILKPFHEGAVRLEPELRYLFNVGSVGQPRDRDPRSAYAIVDTDARTFELRRVSYDVVAAQRRILEQGMDPSLAERLVMGA